MNTTETNAETTPGPERPAGAGQQPMQRIEAHTSDVGGIPVARLLPSRRRRLIGAWCFLDHAGPTRFEAGSPGLRVGAHPHTSLQTFTWMIAGELLHRDSLGHEQVIRPGQVNLMTAGHGISHTEESLPGERHLHAAQLWIALPLQHSHVAPRFDHYPDLPRFDLNGLRATLLMGAYGQHEAPTLSYSPLVGLDLAWSRPSHEVLALRPDFEFGLLPLEGSVLLDGEPLQADQLAYLGTAREQLAIETIDRGRALLIGGAPLDEDITIWWNFVGHGKQAIEQAWRDWVDHAPRFGSIPNASGRRLEPPPIPWPTAE